MPMILHCIQWHDRRKGQHPTDRRLMFHCERSEMSEESGILLKVSTDILPSEEAHASMAPSSWGAQETELTIPVNKKRSRVPQNSPDAVWRVCSFTLDQPPDTLP